MTVKRFSITLPLTLAFCLLGAVLFVVGWQGVSHLRQLNVEMQSAVGDQWKEVRLVHEAFHLSDVNSRLTLLVFLLDDQDEINLLQAERATNTERISDLVRTIEPLLDPDEKALFASVEAARTPYVESYQQALSLLLTEHKRDEARKMMVKVVRPKLIAYHLAWTSFDQHESDEIDQVINKANKEYIAGRRDFLLTLFFADLIAGAIALFTVARMHQEISVRVRTEEELKQHRQHLEELVASRTAALKESNEQLSVEISERKQIEQDLSYGQQRLRLALDAAQIGDWELDLVTQNARRSLRHDQIFGYAELQPEWSYPLFLKHVHPEDRTRVDQAFQESTAAGRDWYFECRIIRADQTQGWIWVRGRVFKNESGRSTNMIGMVGDITERKQIEEQFSMLANNISQFVWMADAKGTIFWYNQRWFDYTGTTLEEMYGWGWQKVHHPDHVQRVVDKIKHCFETGEIWEDTFPLRSKDGQYRWFLSRAVPNRDERGVVLRWFGTNTDITERMEAAERIQKLNEETKRRATELEAANKELEAFSYSVSHDLRAPLRHVHGYVEKLAKATEGQLAPKSQHYMQSITEASEDMGRLIDDLLSFSRLGRAEKQETIIDLGKMVQDTRRGLEMETKNRKIVWNISPLPPVLGDPAMLKQVLANLIGNAVKYSRGRDPAEIEIGCAGEENGCRIFFVRDNGVGFDMQYADKLFGVFQRLHRPEEFEGTGIGLATVRRILTRHGDRVWTESEVNKGATFFFTLKSAKTV